MRITPIITIAAAALAVSLTGCTAPASTTTAATAPAVRETTIPQPVVTSTPAPANTPVAPAPAATPDSTPAPVAAPLDTITAPTTDIAPTQPETIPVSATISATLPTIAVTGQPVAAPVTAQQPANAQTPAPVAAKPTQPATAPATTVAQPAPDCTHFYSIETAPKPLQSIEAFYTDNNAYCPKSTTHLTGTLFSEDAANALQLYGYTGKYVYAYTVATKPTSGVFTPSLWIAPMVYHVFTPVTDNTCMSFESKLTQYNAAHPTAQITAPFTPEKMALICK